MDEITAAFEASRPRLLAIARRMLGADAEAHDAVQDVWLRLHRADAAAIDNVGGWLTTVVSRICLDRLRTRTSRREVSEDEAPARADAADPADDAVVADSVSAALLVVLESLSPAERVTFVLHDVFAVPFEEIAGVVDRSPEATRQLASRARRRVRGGSPTVALDLARHRQVVEAFLRAAQGGDLDQLLRLLDPGVVLRPDAAALQMGSLRELRGAPAVAEALSGGAKAASLALVGGRAGLVWAPGGHVRGAIEFTVEDDRIVAIDVTGDAGRIGQLDVVVL